MQKLARTARAISARQTALQKAEKYATKKARRKVIADNNEHLRERNSLIRAALIARREDWELGPLAPRRDVGEQAEKYGTVAKKLVEGVKKRGKEQKDWGIRVGDRVVVTGKWERERGRIGEVDEVRREKGEVVVKGLNLVNVAVDSSERAADPNKSPFKTTEYPFPLSSVRLVHPLPHPTTGVLTDTIIQSLTINDHNRKRYVTGNETTIPYPPRPPAGSRPEYDVDTLRIDVEEETWVPRLLAEPFPAGVIDELRGKYSKYRTRHEDAYMERLREREEAKRRREEVDKTRMMSPMDEWAEVRRREAEVREEPVLDEGMLERIGRVMARNKGLGVEGGDVQGPQGVEGGAMQGQQQLRT